MTDKIKKTAENVSSEKALQANTASAAVTSQTEQFISQTKAAFDEAATKSREAMEKGLKSVDAITGMARGNVDALLESSRVAVIGLNTIASEVSDFSKNSLERTSRAATELSQAKTTPEIMQLQGEFARTQFNTAIGEVSKIAESMFKMMTEVFEPLQRHAVIAAQIQDLMKDD